MGHLLYGEYCSVLYFQRLLQRHLQKLLHDVDRHPISVSLSEDEKDVLVFPGGVELVENLSDHRVRVKKTDGKFEIVKMFGPDTSGDKTEMKMSEWPILDIEINDKEERGVYIAPRNFDTKTQGKYHKTNTTYFYVDNVLKNLRNI